MPLWVASILGGLLEIASSLVGRAVIALGIGFVSYTGISTGLSAIKTLVESKFTALGADAIQILGVMKMDVCVSILFSALAARLVIRGMTSGSVKKMIFK